MVIEFIELIIQICGIGLVITAAGLWAGAGVSSRPKHRDEQTMIGGAIWSQIIIPIGLMISKVVEETIDQFVEGYYLVTGVLLLWVTGVLLIVYESRRYKRRQRRDELRQAMRRAISLATGETSRDNIKQSRPQSSSSRIFGLFTRSTDLSNERIKYPYDKAYYAIGILCILAGALKMVELVMFVILDTKILTGSNIIV